MQVYLQVVDSTTGQGVNSATITVVDANGNPTGVSTTPYNNGWFEIETGATSNSLSISAPGYITFFLSDPVGTFSMNKPVALLQQASNLQLAEQQALTAAAIAAEQSATAAASTPGAGSLDTQTTLTVEPAITTTTPVTDLSSTPAVSTAPPDVITTTTANPYEKYAIIALAVLLTAVVTYVIVKKEE